jgi:hypothetical protein
MKLKRVDEMRKWDSTAKKSYIVENPLGTVGQLIEVLKKFDPDTKVAINVAEEPSEIIEIEERIVSDCQGRGDGLEMTADWNPDEPVILIMGNQY